MIKVYVKDDCVQCKMTIALMKSIGLKPMIININTTPNLIGKFRSQGMLQAPIVVTDNDSWCGFIPGKIKKLNCINS